MFDGDKEQLRGIGWKSDDWRYGNYRLRKSKKSPYWNIRYKDPTTGKERMVSTKRRDRRTAWEALLTFAEETELGFREPELREWGSIVKKMFERHRFGAKKRNLEFKITLKDIEGLIRANELHCSISGIKFHINDTADVARNPWAPSIDRIDSRLGYVPGNIRIVCLAANLAMNNWGYDVLLRLANGVVRNARAKVFDDTPPPRLLMM